MDPTTLVTFLFKAPPEARTVELLGSWDNFRHAYKMHHDRRRGRGFWSGCFQFRDIVFDGDRAEWSKPRFGGLKQGGTYWYFYRLNDAVEAFDDSIGYTQACPLLPGQTVNVIDVPTEVEDLPSRRRSASIDVDGTLADLHRTHTWDPADKWMSPRPPPVSKVHARCISDVALNGRLENRPVSFRDTASPARERSQPRPAGGRQRSAGDTPSFRSRGTWSSSPESRRDPSIYDAHSIHRHGEPSMSGFPLPDAYRPGGGRAATRGGRSSYRGFDFAFDSNSTRYVHSRTGDDDVDGSSFIHESAGSPPRSAYGSVDWRFTVTSADERAAGSRPKSRGSTHYSYRSYSRSGEARHSPTSDDAHPRDEDDGSPAFDISSPTFSAATISSSGGGLNTPFRLSAGFPSSSTAHPAHDSSLDHVTERLRQLGSEDSAGSLPSQATTADDDDAVAERRFVGHHYALPTHELGVGAESATTLGKASSGRASIRGDAPSLPRGHHAGGGGFDVPRGGGAGGEEGSFADAIFSELGYLGASIA